MKKMLLLIKVMRRQLLFTLNFNEKIVEGEISDIKKIFFFSESYNLTSKNFTEIRNYIYIFFNSSNKNSINPIPGQYQYLTNEFEIPKSNANFYLFDCKTKELALSITKSIHYVGLPFFCSLGNIKILLKLIARKQFYISKISKIGSKLYFILEDVDKKNSVETRRYIPYRYSRRTFMQYLFNLEINAVALRWFDEIDLLGDIKEDIDVLVEDSYVNKINSILNSEVGVLPIDLYSVSGKEKTDYAGLLYYPKKLSQAILETKVIKNGFYVPNLDNYLFSIVYHAVLHKGKKSGIPLDNKTIVGNQDSDHDYNYLIKDLLIKKGIKTPVNLLSLTMLLRRQGYYPSYDLIQKFKNLKKEDFWFDTLLSLEKEEINIKFKNIKGLAVLIIRERGYELNVKVKIEDLIKSFGFYILREGEVESEYKGNAINEIRGGNWGEGPYKLSGGYPQYYYVLYDPFLVKPDDGMTAKYPSLENKKIHVLKTELRNKFNRLSNEENFNAVHSSDEFYESISYLEILGFSEEKISKLIEICCSIKNFYKTDQKIISNLSRHSSRSKIEIIDFKGNLAIKKTFNKYSNRFLRREVSFMQKFEDYNFVPELYEKGENYFISEYYNNSVPLSCDKTKLAKVKIEQLFRIFEALHKKGYCIVDLNPSNVLCVDNKLKLIDFEFAIEIEQPINLIDSYDLKKLPDDVKIDLPMGYKKIHDLYSVYWEPLIGLSKKQFIQIYSKRI